MAVKPPARVLERARERLSKTLASGDPALEKLLDMLASSEAGAQSTTGDLWGAAERLGISPSAAASRGYLQVDGYTRYGLAARRALAEKGVVVTRTGEALEKLGWARDYWWRLLDPASDPYVAAAALHWRGHGYFIYVPPGVRVEQPIYACILLSGRGYAQVLHNIVVVGDGAELTLVTGCATPRSAGHGFHVGLSEYYVGRGAKLSFVMVHAWGPETHVRPRTAVRVAEEGVYASYYIVSGRVASLQQSPRALLDRRAQLSATSVVAASGRSLYDLGYHAVLEDAGARAELVSRVVAKDEAVVKARARIEALAPGVMGHNECEGLQLSPKARIEAVPELVSSTTDARLSHEAAIGAIAEEEIEYLTLRGLSEEEARKLIIRGFLSLENPALPKPAKRIVDATVRLLVEQGGL